MSKRPKNRHIVNDSRHTMKRKANDPHVDLSSTDRVVQQGTAGHGRVEGREQVSQWLLRSIIQAQALFIDEVTPKAVFGVMLEGLLNCTGSEYGLIGEVLWSEERAPLLKTHASTNAVLNKDLRARMAKQTPTLNFGHCQMLVGQVMTTNQPVIVNNPDTDPCASDLPLDRPPLYSFMGLPIHRNEQLIGVVGIANCSGGYDKTLIAYLEPFLSTCAQLLEGYCNRRLRVDAETTLRRSDERWNLAMQGTLDGIWEWDLTSNQTYFSPRWKEMLGYHEHEISENYREWESRLHSEDRERACSALSDYLEGRNARYDVEFRLRKKSGEYCWIQSYGKALWDAQGKPYRMAGSHTDITERKRVDEALCESRERFELAARVTNDGIWDWNILTGEQYWSDRHFELFGLEPRAFTPTYKTWISLVHQDDVNRVDQATRHHLHTHEPYDIEVQVRMKDGRYRWFRDRGQAVWDSTGRPMRMVGSISDVTEHRTAEQAHRDAHAELEHRVIKRTAQLMAANESLEREIAERKRMESRLRTTQYAFDQAADQIFVIGPNGYFLDVNESACRRLGYSKDELLTMSVMDIDPDFPPDMWESFWSDFLRTKRIRLERRHRGKDGDVYPVEVVANYLWHDGHEFDYAVVRDITERKRAEEALRESELRYKLLTEATFDGIAIHDRGSLLEVNAGLERMFGYEPGELIGRSILDLVAEESRDSVALNMRSGVRGPYEAIGCRKDGTTFPGEVVVRPYRYRGKDVRLVAGRDITERKHLEVERARSTEELKCQVAQRTAEIATLEARRTQTEKLAAMGRLAAGVAHEINNPIAGIKNAFTLVKQMVDRSHPHYEFVGMIDREISRVASIVQHMYQLYRPESGKSEVVEIQTMIQDIESLFAKQLQQRRLTLAVNADPHLDRLCVPRGDLLQVLLNLLSNAIDYSHEGGALELSIHLERDVVRMAVSDQGLGIAPECLPHIFDPFFTTKTESEQKGMGLGLSISQSLVLSMGGMLEVDTQLNHGSTFSILLPRHTVLTCAQDRVGINKEVMSHDD